MTTMPITLQERIPIPVGGPAAPTATASAMSLSDLVRILRQRIFLILFIVSLLIGRRPAA